MNKNPGIELLESHVKDFISTAVESLGLLCKIFVRAKDVSSIEEKIQRKKNDNDPYSNSPNGKKMQDLIGVRIVTYFHEDEELLRNFFHTIFPDYDFEKQDAKETTFEPQRRNLICKLSRISLEIEKTFYELQTSIPYGNLIDATFELQFRTIFSEGWHEIDHALKYKCKSEWNGLYEENRMFCGLLATLETADRALKKIFDDVAYKHYKQGNWQAMLRTKFRLHFENKQLDPRIISIFNSDNNLVKSIFKVDRKEIFLKILSSGYKLKPTFNNLVYILNHLINKSSPAIESLVPRHIKIDLETKFPKK